MVVRCFIPARVTHCQPVSAPHSRRTPELSFTAPHSRWILELSFTARSFASSFVVALAPSYTFSPFVSPSLLSLFFFAFRLFPSTFLLRYLSHPASFPFVVSPFFSWSFSPSLFPPARPVLHNLWRCIFLPTSSFLLSFLSSRHSPPFPYPFPVYSSPTFPEPCFPFLFLSLCLSLSFSPPPLISFPLLSSPCFPSPFSSFLIPSLPLPLLPSSFPLSPPPFPFLP